MTSKFYLGVDVETTGQYLSINAIVALGAVVMDEQFNELETFVGYFKIPEEHVWEKRCVDEFWSKNQLMLDKFKKNAANLDLVMKSFAEWLSLLDTKFKDNLVVVSDNVGFDIAWINQYLSLYTYRPSLYYRWCDVQKKYVYRRIWDTDSVMHGALLATTGKVIEWNVESALEVQNDRWKNDHDPLNDARNVVANYILCIKKFRYNNINKT